ncbi:MAG: MCP four helix bundle domain-containing protein, partial [Burkholderiaceae bacterium]|nr:MCP four helix bundle domain-containing protein [Burkholderiaceae bacterium]
MRIGARLAIGFGVVLILMSAITGIGVWRLQEVGSASDFMVKEALMRERLAQDWLSGTTSNGVRTVAMMKSNDAADQKYFQQAISTTSKHISEVQKSIDAMKKEPAEQQMFNTVAEKRKIYTDICGDIMKTKAAGKDDEAKQMVLAKMIPALDAYVDSVHKVLEYQKEQIDKSAASIDANYKVGRMLLIGLGVAAVIIGLIFSSTLTAGITKPLSEAVKVARTVASGDLTARIDVSSKDETGQLLQALKEMNESLFRTVSQVRQG